MLKKAPCVPITKKSSNKSKALCGKRVAPVGTKTPPAKTLTTGPLSPLNTVPSPNVLTQRTTTLKQHKATSSALLRGVLSGALRLAVKPLFAPHISPGLRRRGLELASLSTLNARGIKPTKAELNGVPALRYGDSEQATTVLYLHGGAYTAGSPNTHASLTSHLAQASKTTVWVPDYRLAPEHPFPAALEDALACYQALLSQGVSPEQLTVAGDSAGGGLTLSLMLRQKAEKLPLPKGIVLLSPWADLTHPQDRKST